MRRRVQGLPPRSHRTSSPTLHPPSAPRPEPQGKEHGPKEPLPTPGLPALDPLAASPGGSAATGCDTIDFTALPKRLRRSPQGLGRGPSKWSVSIVVDLAAFRLLTVELQSCAHPARRHSNLRSRMATQSFVIQGRRQPRNESVLTRRRKYFRLSLQSSLPTCRGGSPILTAQSPMLLQVIINPQSIWKGFDELWMQFLISGCWQTMFTFAAGEFVAWRTW